ncbi:FHA domain-containing protein [Streptomyces sp. B6B3]|uniref:FHA domain-containing protein n=1 Tax=Streptomyces sp. B6B3 TaxID=3153570 RepID=UPI00325EAB56
MPIQIRLTVFGQPGGRAAPAGAAEAGDPGVDVQITAPTDAPLGDVLGALAAAVTPGAGTPSVVFCEDRRLDPRRSLLGHPPLVDGAVLAFHHPVTVAPVPEPVPARLLVVSGPDAGGVHLLRGGEIRIGRSAQADVPLDDPDVSRMHCAVSLGADGSVTVTDLGSTNGTQLDGRPVTGGPVPVPAGAALRLGESTLRLITGDAAGDAAGDAGGDAAVVAGPAHSSVPPVPPAAPAAPPEAPRGGTAQGSRRPGRGLAGWARRLGGAAAGETHIGVPPFVPGSPPPSAGEPGEHPAWRGQDEGWGAADPGADVRWPDPATLLLIALEPARDQPPRLWERGPDHPDAFGLRLGTAQRPDGRPAPVTLSLADAGSLGLAGPRARLTGLARSVLAQLTALHPPSALELVVLAPGRAEEWSWTGWLPHLRPRRDQDCRLLVGFDREQAAARIGELAERLGRGPEPTGRRTVVLIDGDVGGADLRQALTRLAVEGPAAGIHLLCLAESPAATPASPLAETLAQARSSFPAFAACGAVSLLSGAVASGLRLIGPGAPAGRDGGAGPVATVDAVSTAWAERFARAVAPVGEPAGGPGGPTAGAATAPPATCRLLDVLDLPRVTPGALRERWARSSGLPLVLGAGAEGLASAQLADVAGPVRIEGGRSSGRTELLCSLAASLAAAHAPRDLSLLLVEGSGEGLRPSAELPHVASYLGATDPVRMRAFAQALRGELKRRAALLGDAEFGSGWRRGGRIAAPRPAGDEALLGAGPTAADAGAPAGEPGLPAMLAEGSGPLPWLVVLVDDIDALLAPALGAPGRPAAGSMVRALVAAAREGQRLGVRLITVGTPADVLPDDAPPAAIRVALTGQPPGRAELRAGDGRAVPFQAARVTGRIPRTATLRPTVTRLDWARAGDPPARRPVRELGNGPTDVALLASAAARAARSGTAATASLV